MHEILSNNSPLNLLSPITLNKSELPSGALILALQAVGYHPQALLQAAATMHCSNHLVRFTMLSAHGALEHLSMTQLQKGFFWQIYMVMESGMRLVPMGR